MDEDLENVVLAAHGPESAALMREVGADLRAAGVPAEVRMESFPPQAVIDWTAVTIAVAWIGDKYFGAMISDIGKSHFSQVKAALAKIFAGALGPRATVHRVLTRADGKVIEERVFSGSFSVAHRSREGWRAKLLFPLEVTEADYQRACAEFLRLLDVQQRDAKASSLERELVEQANTRRADAPPELSGLDVRAYLDVLLFWNAAEARFHVVDLAQSSMRNRLVSSALGMPRRY